MQLQCPNDTGKGTKYTFPKPITFDVLLIQSSFEILTILNFKGPIWKTCYRAKSTRTTLRVTQIRAVFYVNKGPITCII